MALRLPQILVAMTLILVAGILSVQHLERLTGGPTVPGIVVLDGPAWGPEELAAIADELGGVWGEVAAGDGPLAPFDRELVTTLAARGDATVLCVSDAGPELELLGWHDPDVWEVSLPPTGSGARALETAETFIRAQTAMRSFLVGILLGDLPPAAEPLRQLISSIGRLPSYRRTALVVLGRRSGPSTPGGPDLRHFLRLDLGDWGHRPRAGLDDLLDPGW